MADEQAKTIRLPRDLYERLRRIAFERHIAQNQLIVAAIAEKLDKEQQ